jgi:putative transposase
MPCGLRRFQESGQSHFVTFSCYRRRPYFANAEMFDQFVPTLEDMRRRFELCIYGYVVMPEHVHLLLSEPPQARLAEAIHYLKLSFAKRVRSLRAGEEPGSIWQKRYYDAT